MIAQRKIVLAPSENEAWRITYPPTESRRREWTITPMKFIPHSGRATQ